MVVLELQDQSGQAKVATGKALPQHVLQSHSEETGAKNTLDGYVRLTACTLTSHTRPVVLTTVLVPVVKGSVESAKLCEDPFRRPLLAGSTRLTVVELEA